MILFSEFNVHRYVMSRGQVSDINNGRGRMEKGRWTLCDDNVPGRRDEGRRLKGGRTAIVGTNCRSRRGIGGREN